MSPSERTWDGMAFIVYDRHRVDVPRSFEHKGDAIAAAQTLNGFIPVDGSEETFGNQIEALALARRSQRHRRVLADVQRRLALARGER